MSTANRADRPRSGAAGVVAVVVLAALLCSAAAAGATLLLPSRQSWQSTTVLVVGGEASGGYRAAQTYALVIEGSPTVIGAVARSTGQSTPQVEDGLAVQAVQDTALLRVTYAAPTPEQATRALTALADELTATGGTPLVGDAPLVVLSGPADPVRVGVGRALVIAAAGAVGAALGLFLALAHRAVRPRARSRRQVESVTGAPVLGPVRDSADLGAALRAVVAARPAGTGTAPSVAVVVGPRARSGAPADATALAAVAAAVRAGARSTGLAVEVVVHEAGAPAPRPAPGTVTVCRVVAQGRGEVAVAAACDGVLLVVRAGSPLAATADVAAQLAVVDRPVNLAVLLDPAALDTAALDPAALLDPVATGTTADLRESPAPARTGP